LREKINHLVGIKIVITNYFENTRVTGWSVISSIMELVFLWQFPNKLDKHFEKLHENIVKYAIRK